MHYAVSDRVSETTQIFKSAAVKSKVLQRVRAGFNSGTHKILTKYLI